MTPKRLNAITLGVQDLARSADFYEAAFGLAGNRSYDGVVFFELPGTWLSLFPIENLAQDISPEIPTTRAGFSGITFGHNARSREDVIAIFEHLARVGARIVKPPHDTFWGGFSGYFADPDGYYWEVAWGPMFDFTADGTLCFKETTEVSTAAEAEGA